MNSKTDLSAISFIDLNQIIDDEEYKLLLNQKLQSFAFQSNFLQELSKPSSHQSFLPSTHSQVNNKNPKTYDSQALKQERKLMQLAYEKNMRSGKLLSNPIFKIQQKTQQNTLSSYTHDDDKADYFLQYIKWKAEFECKKQNNLNSNLINHKKILEKIQFSPEPEVKSNFLRKQNTYDADQLKAELNKIRQQYLLKVTNATSKQMFPQRIDLSKIDSKVFSNSQKSYDKISQNSSPANSSRFIEAQNNQLHQPINQTFNEENEMRPDKFEDSDINEYCFENMIKRKPDFVVFKKIKNQANQLGFGSNQKTTQQQIQQEYLFQRNASKLQNNESNDASLCQQSRLTRKSTSKQQTTKTHPQADQYYRQLKQMIRSGYDQQAIRNKQINKNQIPTNQAPKPVSVVRLNIHKLLKLPYKEFILFFEQNHRKIVSMTQPEQYKRLQAYQAKCLEHAESIDKLRERFSSEEGARLIGRLSAEQKEKLFKVLYQKYP